MKNNTLAFLTIALLTSGYAWAMNSNDALTSEREETVNEMNKIIITCKDTQNDFKYSPSPDVQLEYKEQPGETLRFNPKYPKYAHTDIRSLLQESECLSNFLNNLPEHMEEIYSDNSDNVSPTEQQTTTYKTQDNLSPSDVERTTGRVEGAIVGTTITALAAFIYITFFLNCPVNEFN